MYEWERKTGMSYYSRTVDCARKTGTHYSCFADMYRQDSFLHYLNGATLLPRKAYKAGGYCILRAYTASQLPFWLVTHGASIPSKEKTGEIICDIHAFERRIKKIDAVFISQETAKLNKLLQEKYPEYQISFALIYSLRGQYGCTGVANADVHFFTSDTSDREKVFSMQNEFMPRVFDTWVSATSCLKLQYNKPGFEMEGGITIPAHDTREIISLPGYERYARFRDIAYEKPPAPSVFSFFNRRSNKEPAASSAPPRDLAPS